MSAERHLEILEGNCLLENTSGIPTPERSNFYWINSYEDKFKAFIPTPNRYIYYNLEEFKGDRELIEGKDTRHMWTLVKKCVLLAVLVDSPADRQFKEHMEILIAKTRPENVDSWFRHNYIINELRYEKEDKSLYTQHYVLTKYFVHDIKNVPVEYRWRFSDFKMTISVNPNDDPAGVIHDMDIAFEKAAERFVNDADCGVYAYSNAYRNY